MRITRANVCGSDVHAWLGHFDLRRRGAEFPTVLGHEAAGVVAELADGVTRDSAGRELAVGDPVTFSYFEPCGSCRPCVRGQGNSCVSTKMAMFGTATRPPHFIGTFGDYFVLGPRAIVLKAADHVPPAVLAGVNCALAQVMCGFQAVPNDLGDAVVIQGAGGLGLFAAAVARERGASSVIVIDGSPERLELAQEFGATDVIWMEPGQSSRDRVKAVRRLTEGWGADMVVEVAGTEKAMAEGIEFLGNAGRYLMMGSIAAIEPAVVSPARVIVGNQLIRGVGLYDGRALSQALSFLERRLSDLPFDKLASETFPLEAAEEALRSSSQHNLGRPSLAVSEGV